MRVYLGRILMVVFFALILSLFCLYPEIDYRLTYEAFVGLCFLSGLVALDLSKKIHPSIAIAFLYFALSGLWGFFFPINIPIPRDPILIARSGSETLYALVVLFLFAFMLLSQSRNFFNSILKLLYWSAVMDSAVLILKGILFSEAAPFSMLNNGTADACFIACLLPIAFQNNSLWPVFIMLGAILSSKSNTAFAGLGLAFATWLWTRKINFRQWLLWTAPLLLFLAFSSRFFLGDHLLENSGRFGLWRDMSSFYYQYANQWLGFGTGSFTNWGIAAQYAKAQGHPQILWPWMHNEIFQIIFENGVIGWVFTFIAFLDIFKRTYRKPVFPVFCVYSFTCLTEMPLRLFVTQMLGLCVLASAFKGPERGRDASTPKPRPGFCPSL